MFQNLIEFPHHFIADFIIRRTSVAGARCMATYWVPIFRFLQDLDFRVSRMQMKIEFSSIFRTQWHLRRSAHTQQSYKFQSNSDFRIVGLLLRNA